MKKNSYHLMVWNFFATRLLIFLVMVFEATPGTVIGVLLLLPELSLLERGNLLNVATTLSKIMGLLVIFAELSFLLAIRYTQQIKQMRVSLIEWGMTGLISSNTIVLVGSIILKDWIFEYNNLSSAQSVWTMDITYKSLGLFLLTIFVDWLVCVVLDRFDSGVYVPSEFLDLPVENDSKANTEKRLLPADMLAPIRTWILELPITSNNSALLIVVRIPATCPFERIISFKGLELLRIPPLCKLNPLYEALVVLRFRALNYLADNGVDVAPYC